MANDSPVKRRRLVAPHMGCLARGARGKSRSAAPGEQLSLALSTATASTRSFTPFPQQETVASREVDFGSAGDPEGHNLTTWVEYWHPNQYNWENQRFEAGLCILTSEFLGYYAPTGARATTVIPQGEPNGVSVSAGQRAVVASAASTGEKRKRDDRDDDRDLPASKFRYREADHLRYPTTNYDVQCPLPLKDDPNNLAVRCHKVIPLIGFGYHIATEHGGQQCTLKEADGSVCSFTGANLRKHLLCAQHGKVYGHEMLANRTMGPLKELPPIACKHCEFTCTGYPGGNSNSLRRHIWGDKCPNFKYPAIKGCT
ncbi:hypothetical protein EST38_g13558 [Candolleomyces aberdarensis]|uniref:Uncharacterized protein n=1 Tax=Candolleomyces aberdarensis TaxID=2316362 RepID=A0A4Q2D1G4_9AGAR|nr:hypothetical protein EST38_g13558 [Candolleomyces aberdarensis]